MVKGNVRGSTPDNVESKKVKKLGFSKSGTAKARNKNNSADGVTAKDLEMTEGSRAHASESSSSNAQDVDMSSVTSDKTLEIHQLDPGSAGDCSLILLKDNGAIEFSILIDGTVTLTGKSNDASPLENYLKHHLQGTKLNAIIISHFDKDHYEGIFQIIKNYLLGDDTFLDKNTKYFSPIDPTVETEAEIKKILGFKTLYPREVLLQEELLEAALKSKENDKNIKEEQIKEKYQKVKNNFNTGTKLDNVNHVPDLSHDKLKTYCISIDTKNIGESDAKNDKKVNDGKVREIKKEGQLQYKGESKYTNKSSLGFILEFDGFKFYTAGDLTHDVERQMAPNLQKVDAMKLSHHGSNTSTPKKLLNALNPRIAVISAGMAHKHPDKEVIQRLQDNKNDLAARLQNYLITSKFDEPSNYIDSNVNIKSYDSQLVIFAGARNPETLKRVKATTVRSINVGGSNLPDKQLEDFIGNKLQLADRGHVIFEVKAEESSLGSKPFVVHYFTNFKKRYVNKYVQPYLIEGGLPRYLAGAKRYADADKDVILKKVESLETSSATQDNIITLQWYKSDSSDAEVYEGSSDDPSKFFGSIKQGPVDQFSDDTRSFLAITQKLILKKIEGNGEDKDWYLIVKDDGNAEELDIPGITKIDLADFAITDANNPKLKDVKVTYDEKTHQITIKEATLIGFFTEGVTLIEKTIKPQKRELYELLGRPVKLPGIQKLCLYDSNKGKPSEEFEITQQTNEEASGSDSAQASLSASPAPKSFELLSAVLSRITADRFKNYFNIDSFLLSGAQSLANGTQGASEANIFQTLANKVNENLTVKQIYLDYSLNKTLHTKITFNTKIHL
jgi:beta-lactamase superfamily II metal-dependent hydrolase